MRLRTRPPLPYLTPVQFWLNERVCSTIRCLDSHQTKRCAQNCGTDNAHVILRCRQIPKFSCRTIAETAEVAILPPPQSFLAHFSRFLPVLYAVKPI